MDQNDFYACISMLSDQAMSNLRAKKCAPLPKHFQNEFNLLLESSASEDLICNLNKEDIKIEETDDQKYLEIAKLALDSFIANHGLTELIMSNHHDRLPVSENYDENYLKANCHKVVDSLSILDSEMMQMLIKAQDRIHDLKTQLEQTLKENMTDPLTKFYNRKALWQDLVALTKIPHGEREREKSAA